MGRTTWWSRCVHSLLVAVTCVLAPGTAAAQLEQGRLTGTVTDAQGAVLPGVTVTATSPALIGTQTAITEENGTYRFPALPSGAYALTFELTGFRTIKRDNIQLSIGQTLTVDLALEVSAIQETVLVTSESPVVDLQSTKVGVEFSAEKLASIPSATDLWAALGQAPGVRMLGFDVGGSHKSQQVGYESFGVRGQNRVVTEGIDTTEGTNAAGIYQDFFAHEEVSVSASGADVQMSTPGSAVVSSIKSGGNRFSSLNNVTYEGSRFVDNNIDDETFARGFTGQPNLKFWEAHFDLGGPIKTDKVWFYAAYNAFTIDKVISGVPRQYTDLAEFTNYTVKGTYRMSQKDTLVGYYQWGSKDKPRRGLSATVGPDSILAQNAPSEMWNAQHQRVWTNRLFTDTKVGWWGFAWPMVPAVDWRQSPPRVDTAKGNESGAGWLAGNQGGPFTFQRDKPQFTMTATYYLPDKMGDHDFKAGVEYANDQSRNGNNGNSGPILYRDRTNAITGVLELDEIRLADYNTFETFGTDWTGPDDRNLRWSAFFQDRWRPASRVTITAGVRFDRQRPHYEASIRNPILTEVFQAQTVPARNFFTRSTIVPRLGVAYDVSSKGKSVAKVFYGRYYYNFADRLAAGNPGGTNRCDYKFLDANGNRLYDGPAELGARVGCAGGSTTTVDPDLKTPYADEISVSYEQQFWGESSVRVAYVRKMTRDDFATYNVAREGQFTVPRTISLPLLEFGQAAGETRSFVVYDIPASLSGQIRNVIASIPESVGGGDNNYDTIQFAFIKRLPGGLFVQSSLDYQWRDELRTTANASNSPLDSDPLGINYFQNVFPDVSNRQESTNWQGRLMGRYETSNGFGAAINWRIQSGWNYARIMSVPLTTAGTQLFFMEDIKNNRSDMASLLDVRVEKSFRFLEKYKVVLMADLFNALNSNAVTNFNLSNENFKRINATLDPRTAMIGARFAF
jgi:Carboxypeptidase regulatory-like domain/TonB dependent receptor